MAVTGSTGLIGSALCEALEAAGDAVVRVVRGAARSGEVGWDPAAGTIDASGLEGVDAVVHLAGRSIGQRRWTAAEKQRVLLSRTTGTELLARTLASLERPPAVLVSASAVGFYGDRGDEVLTEESGPGEGFMADVVRRWEEATGPAAEAGIRVALARSGVVLARDGGMLPRMLLPFRLFVGGRMGSGRQHLSWISLRDEVRALQWLLDHELSGPVNCTSPEPVTNAELAATLGRVLRRPAVVPAPAFALRAILGRELADELVLGSARVVPSRLLESGFEFEHPDLEGALRDLLQSPRSLG